MYISIPFLLLMAGPWVSMQYLPNGQQSSKYDQVPIMPGEPRNQRDGTPECQTDGQKDLTVAVVSQEPGEHSSQNIGVVEDGPGHHLVEETSSIEPPPAGIVRGVIVDTPVLSGVTGGLILTVGNFKKGGQCTVKKDQLLLSDTEGSIQRGEEPPPPPPPLPKKSLKQ